MQGSASEKVQTNQGGRQITTKLSRTAVKDMGSGKQNHFFLPDLSRFSLLQGGAPSPSD